MLEAVGKPGRAGGVATPASRGGGSEGAAQADEADESPSSEGLDLRPGKQSEVVVLSDEGIRRGQALFDTYFGVEEKGRSR